MKRLLSLVAFFATLQASAQQVNPVPDYVFRNQMSVGRGTVTDTAAYFSIGPRYGATKGFMPPIVGDTATFSSGKRNGLLIFSVQKNKFLYWDSVRVQWSDMAGGSGSYILAGDTSAMLAPYLRKADTTAMLLPYVRHAGYGLTKSGQSFLVDTLNIATRAWRQKGIDSLAALEVSGSGTTNYVAKFTAGSTIGNSQIFDNGTNVGIGTTSPTTPLTVNGRGTFTDANGGVIIGQYLSVPGFGGIYSTQVTPSGSNYNFLVSGTNTYISSPNGFIRFDNAGTERMRITSDGDILHRGTYNPLSAANRGNIMLNGSASNIIGFSNNSALRGYIFHTDSDFQFYNNTTGGRVGLYTEGSARLWIQANGRIGINTTTDAGYQLDINGTLRSVNGANFATTSGNVGVNTASPVMPFQLNNFGGFDGNGNQLIIRNNVYYNNTNARSEPIQNGYQTQIEMENLDGKIRFSTSSASNNVGTAASLVERMRITNNGEVLIGTTSDAGDYKLQVAGNIYTTGNIQMTGSAAIRNSVSQFIDYGTGGSGDLYIRGGSGFANVLTATNAGEVLVNTGTDAGDYKLQVVGNARVGTGKLDIASNTTFGLGVARSGTSEVAGQIYNSNGILYTGVESSAGGQIFSGSSAYAAVIGSGANYPLQFASNNITRATLNTSGELQIGSTSDVGDYKLQVIGNGYFGGSITTNAPDGGNAKPWKLGSVISTTVILDTAKYVEVEINGVAYKLALVTPN